MIKPSSLTFALALTLTPLRASAGDCTSDSYGSCGEKPPESDRYKDPPKEAPAKPEKPEPAPAPAQPAPAQPAPAQPAPAPSGKS